MSGFDDGFSERTVKRDATDNALDLVRLAVALTLRDPSREDDVFEVKNREVVIVEFFGCVGGDNVMERAHQGAEMNNAGMLHQYILSR